MIITMKDGSILERKQQESIYDLVKEVNVQLTKEAFAAEMNGEIVDLRETISHDCTLNILTFEDAKGRAAFWHTTSHILAQAVKQKLVAGFCLN